MVNKQNHIEVYKKKVNQKNSSESLMEALKMKHIFYMNDYQHYIVVYVIYSDNTKSSSQAV